MGPTVSDRIRLYMLNTAIIDQIHVTRFRPITC